MQSEKYEIDDGENEIESNDTSFGRGAWVCGGETWQARARVSTSEVVGGAMGSSWTIDDD